MKRLILVIPFLVLALAGTTLAAQDPEIRELIDRMRALEETVESQRQEIEFQRGEIEGLKAGQAGSRGPRRYEPVALRSPGEAEYGVSDERLQEVVKDYLGTEQGKKLITDTSPFKLKAGYKKGKGFYLETLDEKFKMYIYNRLQVRYTFADNDESSDTSSFRIRRYKIKFAGHAFTKDLTYKVQWNLASNSGAGKLEAAWANYKLTDYLQLRGGQYKVPYNRQELTSSAKQLLVDRSLANDEFNFSYDIGVMAHARPLGGLLEYNLAVMQGAGANATKNTNTQMLYAARFVLSPLGKFDSYVESDLKHHETPKLALGGAVAYNDGKKMFLDDKVRTFNRGVSTKQATVDLIFKWRGLALMGDGYWRRVDAHTGESDFRGGGIDATGYTLQAGYFVPTSYLQKRLEFGGRYSHVDPDTSTSNDYKYEVGGGMNWYFNGQNNKFQADIRRVFTKQPSDSDERDTEFRLQYQLVF
ncbi:MAG: porin [Candidatus Brocadiales bacterium]